MLADWRAMGAPEFDPDPLRQLASWLVAARAAAAPMPEAMALSSASADGQPSVRMVILRGLDDGLMFFTDAESDKVIEPRCQSPGRSGVPLAAADQSPGPGCWFGVGRLG